MARSSPFCHVSPPKRMPWSAEVSERGSVPGSSAQTHWSAFSTKSSVPSSVVVHDPPPYSCTRDRAVRAASAHRRAAAFLGDALAPPDVIADEPRTVDARGRRRHISGGEG